MLTRIVLWMGCRMRPHPIHHGPDGSGNDHLQQRNLCAAALAFDAFSLALCRNSRRLECKKSLHFCQLRTLLTRIQIYARRVLIFLEVIGGVCHVVFFFVIIITLLILAPRSTNDFVWNTTVSNVSGWKDPGVAFCLGLLSPTYVLAGTCFDCITALNLPLTECY